MAKKAVKKAALLARGRRILEASKEKADAAAAPVKKARDESVSQAQETIDIATPDLSPEIGTAASRCTAKTGGVAASLKR